MLYVQGGGGTRRGGERGAERKRKRRTRPGVKGKSTGGGHGFRGRTCVWMKTLKTTFIS